ncbi:MAG: hypothetical protein ACK559_13900, partial [bacterium]
EQLRRDAGRREHGRGGHGGRDGVFGTHWIGRPGGRDAGGRGDADGRRRRQQHGEPGRGVGYGGGRRVEPDAEHDGRGDGIGGGGDGHRDGDDHAVGRGGVPVDGGRGNGHDHGHGQRLDGVVPGEPDAVGGADCGGERVVQRVASGDVEHGGRGVDAVEHGDADAGRWVGRYDDVHGGGDGDGAVGGGGGQRRGGARGGVAGGGVAGGVRLRPERV